MTREQFIIGVDLGGTNVVVGAMPVDGSREIGVRTLPTRAELGADGVTDRIAAMIENVVADVRRETGAERSDVIGVGVGSPGPLDRERGVVIVTPNLGWRDYPLRDELSNRVGIRATLDNDANCATLGEWWRGAARGGRNVVGMTLGTGIGGGLVLDGKLYHGASDAAGEIGHTSIDSNGRLCKCGNYGCLEAYCSGPAIAVRAREAMESERSPVIEELVNGDMSKLTAHIVYEAARRGDLVAREVVRDTARFLGTGISNLINIFNPDTVVLAGGVTQAGEALMDPLRAEVRRRAFKPAVDACRIVLGTLPVSAGMVGAVATFKQQVMGLDLMPQQRRRLGVVGTFVWDEIHGRDPAQAPVQEWGGITYALSALDAALDDEWEIVPVIKVGSDLAQRARDYLRTLRRIAPGAAIIEVPYANNRVTLRYQSAERRTEQLSGGIPAWHWLGLKPLLSEVDALYVNLISGFEVTLEIAQLTRQNFSGPIYCDLHSLLLAVSADGFRIPHAIQNVPAWMQCFDLLQVNEDEMSLLAPDPMALAATAMAGGVSVINVTLGPRGVVYFAAPNFERLSDVRRAALPGGGAARGAIRTALVPAAPTQGNSLGDPTGCGDVWGATYFARLLAGDKLGDAITAAMRAAARNVDHRGATGLANYLRGEIALT